MHTFFLISMLFLAFFRFTHQCTFCHITAKLAKAENLMEAAQCQINPVPGISKFCANLKQKTQILSVLIAHANTIPIVQSVKNTVVQSVRKLGEKSRSRKSAS